ILNNTIVDDGDPIGDDRVGIGLGRLAMSRPARVADPDSTLHRLIVEALSEIVELTLGPPPLDAPVDQGRDPGRIIAAVFATAQPFEQPRRYRFLGDDTNNPAHRAFLFT